MPPTRPLSFVPRLFLLALLLIFVIACLVACGGPQKPPPNGGGGDATEPTPEQVAAVVYQSGLLGVTTGKLASLSAEDGGLCLAMSIADGALRAAYQVFSDASAEVTSPDGTFDPPIVIIDAAACIPLGIPHPADSSSAEAEWRASAAVGVAAARSVALMLCGQLGNDAPECYGASWSAAVAEAGLDAWTAVALALYDEGRAPDGIVAVELDPLSYPLLSAPEEEPAGDPGDDDDDDDQEPAMAIEPIPADWRPDLPGDGIPEESEEDPDDAGPDGVNPDGDDDDSARSTG